RVVPGLDGALEDAGHRVRGQLEVVDAAQVVGDRDGRRRGRHVHELTGRGAVARLDEAVRTGEVVQALAEVLLAGARADGVVGDLQVVLLTERVDGGLVEGVGEGCAGASDRAGAVL